MRRINLGQTVTILANLGVLVGILLLVYELNQNREMMRSQTRDSIAEMLINLLALEASDPRISEIYVKRASGEPLTPVEADRFQTIQWAYWRYRENVHYQYRNGLYEEEEYLALRAVWLRDLDTDELVRSIFCESLYQRSPALADEMTRVMARPCD